MSIKKTIEALTKALLKGGKMDQALFESELAIYIEDWYESLQADQDEFVFAILEDCGQVAMTMIMKDKTIYANEDARQKLSDLWPETYAKNMQQMIPMMAEILADDVIFFTGINVV